MFNLKPKGAREAPPDPRVDKDMMPIEKEEDERVNKNDDTKTKHYLEPKSNKYIDTDPKKRGTIDLNEKTEVHIDPSYLDGELDPENKIVEEIDNEGDERKQKLEDKKWNAEYHDKEIQKGVIVRWSKNNRNYEVLDVVPENSEVLMKDISTGREVSVDIKDVSVSMTSENMAA